MVDDKSKFDISFVNPPCDVVEDLSEDSVQEPRNFELEADLNPFPSSVDRPQVSVKGKLNSSFHHWQSLGAPEFILSVIRCGYKIPFISTPPSQRYSNNASAINEAEFVGEAILELLRDNRVEELFSPPDIVNPLSFSVQSSGKKRLILDLRHINLHVYKQKFKCEGLHTIKSAFAKDYFVFSFDLKSGYHHVDIFPDHRKYLAFSWDFVGGHTRYFQFTVLPFGLSSAPYIFTKLLKPLETHWRAQGIPIAIFFDDGVGAGSSLEAANFNSFLVRSDLSRCGFEINHGKSNWEPMNKFSWIGYNIDTHRGFIFANDSRIEKLCSDLNDLCAKLELSSFVHVKEIASVVGQIISMTASCGNVSQIMTRYLHLIINSRRSWNSAVFVHDQGKEELYFWKDNLRALNGVSFWPVPFVPSKVLFSDASSTGCGAFIQDSSLVCHRNWSAEESQKSSTWRELFAIKFALEAFGAHLAGQRVRCNTDNQNVVRIIQVGSMVKELQDIALNVFLFTSHRRIQLNVIWLPRDQNSQADFFSRIVDFDDYSLHDEVFFQLDELWGPHSVDRFACSYNTKLPRFNSRFLQPGTEAVDAFSQDWSSENNWLVPPTILIGRSLSHMRDCMAAGTLIVPMWKSAQFWPLLCNDGVHLNPFVREWLFLPRRSDLFVKGRAKNTLFGNKALKSRCLAL